jgi:hypothetical protein
MSQFYTSETQFKQQRLPCLFFVWIKIETSVNYGLEISFQKTNDFGIFASLPEQINPKSSKFPPLSLFLT